jgi:hypothetical protein
MAAGTTQRYDWLAAILDEDKAAETAPQRRRV